MFVLFWVHGQKRFLKKATLLACMFVSAFDVQSTDNILKYKRTVADESIATFHSLTFTSYLQYFHLVNSSTQDRDIIKGPDLFLSCFNSTRPFVLIFVFTFLFS